MFSFGVIYGAIAGAIEGAIEGAIALFPFCTWNLLNELIWKCNSSSGNPIKAKKMWQHGDKWQGFDPISDPNFDRNTDPNVDFKLPHIVCIFLGVSDTTFQIHSILLMVQCVVLAYHPLEINEFRDWLTAYSHINVWLAAYFRFVKRLCWLITVQILGAIGGVIDVSLGVTSGIRYFANEFENAIYRLGNQLCVRVSIMRTIECCFCQCGNDDFYNYWLEEALRHTHYAMRYRVTNVQEYMCYPPSVFSTLYTFINCLH